MAGHDGRWDVCLVELSGERNYLPIAAANLAAYANADEHVRSGLRIRMVLDDYQTPASHLLGRVSAARGGLPDVLALSGQGWSVRQCDTLARSVKQASPNVLIVYGGNHVSHQGHRFFESRPFADCLVNGEGEETFRELLLRFLKSPQAPDLDGVLGLTYRMPDGSLATNRDRPRIAELDNIPSPFLTGIVDDFLADASTVMLETNRGCPYHCSFCYWGMATNSRVRRYSYERLQADMAFLAEHRVDSWYICDANFGLLPQDSHIVDEIVRLRATHGYPRTVHTNWAKNSNERIVELCARLNAGGVHSTYSLALQSTTKAALEISHRSNMKINRIDELAQLCRQYGVIPRGELIWGLPGETYDDFLSSYDDLAEHTEALSVYPLYVLPNTEYAERVDDLGIVTARAEEDTDYEYCVGHRQMSFDDYLSGLRFIVSNNIAKVGGVFFRLYPRVAFGYGRIPYHETIGGLGDWIQVSDHPTARRFKKYYESPLALHRQSLTEVWLTIAYDYDGLMDMFQIYAEDMIHSRVSADVVGLLRDALRFDVITHPLFDDAAKETAESIDGCYVTDVQFDYDVLGLRRGEVTQPRRGCYDYRILRPAGLWQYPVSNWYFGLIGYEARVTRLTHASSLSSQVAREL